MLTLPPPNLVWYADDDPDDRELVTETFKAQKPDVKIVTFQNGSSLLNFIAFRNYSDPKPCLIILDINMPLLNGIDTLRQLRATDGYSHTPIVLFSTSSNPADAAAAAACNATLVTKPLEIKQMNQIVKRFIEVCQSNGLVVNEQGG